MSNFIKDKLVLLWREAQLCLPFFRLILQEVWFGSLLLDIHNIIFCEAYNGRGSECFTFLFPWASQYNL